MLKTELGFLEEQYVLLISEAPLQAPNCCFEMMSASKIYVIEFRQGHLPSFEELELAEPQSEAQNPISLGHG